MTSDRGLGFCRLERSSVHLRVGMKGWVYAEYRCRHSKAAMIITVAVRPAGEPKEARWLNIRRTGRNGRRGRKIRASGGNGRSPRRKIRSQQKSQGASQSFQCKHRLPWLPLLLCLLAWADPYYSWYATSLWSDVSKREWHSLSRKTVRYRSLNQKRRKRSPTLIKDLLLLL